MRSRSIRSPPLLAMSLSLKAHRNGRSKRSSTVHAASWPGTAGLSGVSGIRAGKLVAAAL